MTWKKRLREIVAAGGALAAGACAGSGKTTDTGAGVTSVSQEPRASDDASGIFVEASDNASGSANSGGCCNGYPDPCCLFTCGIDDFDAEYGCGQERACQDAGGTWNPYYSDVPPHCEFEADEADAALDGSWMDADAATPDSSGDEHD
jgi:hypothetical protein